MVEFEAAISGGGAWIVGGEIERRGGVKESKLPWVCDESFDPMISGELCLWSCSMTCLLSLLFLLLPPPPSVIPPH